MQLPAKKSSVRSCLDIDRVRVDTEKNFCDILDKVHELSQDSVDTTHVFALSQVYEGLLLKMGKKAMMAANSLPRVKSSERWSR